MEESNPYATPKTDTAPREIPSLGTEMGEIFESMVDLIKKYPWPMLLPVAFYTLVLSVASYLLIDFLLVDMLSALETMENAETAENGETGDEEFEPFMMAFAYIMVAGLGLGLFQMLFNLFYALTVGNLIESGSPGELTARIGRTLARFLPYFLLTLLTIPLLGVGLILCYIPGLVLMNYFSLLGPLVVIGRRNFSALGACFRLLSGRFWTAALVYIAIYFGFSTLSSFLTYPAMFWSMSDTFISGAEPSPQQILDSLGAMILPIMMITVIGYCLLNLASVVMYVRFSRWHGEDPFRPISS